MSDPEVTPAWTCAEWTVHRLCEDGYEIRCEESGDGLCNLLLADLRAIRALCDRAIREEGDGE